MTWPGNLRARNAPSATELQPVNRDRAFLENTFVERAWQVMRDRVLHGQHSRESIGPPTFENAIQHFRAVRGIDERNVVTLRRECSGEGQGVPFENARMLLDPAQRGVKVTMINSKSIDKILVGHAQRSFYEELLGAGVEIYLYQTPAFLHTKQVTIDDEVAILGSSNLDIRSFELSQEVGLVLYDKTAVQTLRKIERAYLARSTQVRAKAWAARPLRLKLLDNISRLAASLL